MSYVGTRTALGSNATYTSPAMMSNRDDTVVGAVLADQAGTLNIEQGYPDDATGLVSTWTAIATVAVVASTPTPFSQALVAPKWRLRYVNGASAQGTFRVDAKTTAAGDS